VLVHLGRLRHHPREPTVPIRGPEQHDDCVPALTTAAPLPNGTTGFAIVATSGTRQVQRMVFVRSLAHPASPTSAAAADTTAIATTVTAAAPAAAAAAAATATAAVALASAAAGPL
jgi:hypothetical protein